MFGRVRPASAREQLAHVNKAMQRNGWKERYTGCRAENLPMLALVYEDVCMELGPPACCQVPDDDGIDSVDFDDTEVETVL
jgi:hypothetical protein